MLPPSKALSASVWHVAEAKNRQRPVGRELIKRLRNPADGPALVLQGGPDPASPRGPFLGGQEALRAWARLDQSPEDESTEGEGQEGPHHCGGGSCCCEGQSETSIYKVNPRAGVLIIHREKKKKKCRFFHLPFICRPLLPPQPGCSLGTSIRKRGVTSQGGPLSLNRHIRRKCLDPDRGSSYPRTLSCRDRGHHQVTGAGESGFARSSLQAGNKVQP